MDEATPMPTTAPVVDAAQVTEPQAPAAEPVDGVTPEQAAKLSPSALDMARMIKREQKLRQRELEMKRQIESERGELQSKYKTFEQAASEKSLAKRAEMLGINYADLTKELLSSDPASQVALEVQELKAQLAERDKREQEARQEAEQSRQQATLAEAKRSIAAQIDHGSDFDLVKAFGMSGAVAEHLTQAFSEGRHDLTAADVAATLEAQIEAALSKALTTSKGRQILARLTPDETRGGPKSAQSRAGSTLTNAIAAMRVSDSDQATSTRRVRSFAEENADIAKRIAAKLG